MLIQPCQNGFTIDPRYGPWEDPSRASIAADRMVARSIGDLADVVEKWARLEAEERKIDLAPSPMPSDPDLGALTAINHALEDAEERAVTAHWADHAFAFLKQFESASWLLLGSSDPSPETRAPRRAALIEIAALALSWAASMERLDTREPSP